MVQKLWGWNLVNKPPALVAQTFKLDYLTGLWIIYEKLFCAKRFMTCVI